MRSPLAVLSTAVVEGLPTAVMDVLSTTVAAVLSMASSVFVLKAARALLPAIAALALLAAAAVHLAARPAAAAPAAAPVQLEAVRFEKLPDGRERVVFTLSGRCIPQVTVFDGESLRLVSDFHGARLQPSVKRVIELDGRLVQRIRIGLHEGMIRAVCDLAPGIYVDVQQFYSEKENSFVLVVTEIP